ncbi:MAG TPA: hypothetical protein VGR62_17525 [Candidatus Binatia bacterium]|jgi:hypothetical protein|nr:hypothetical protein [Candidatus Binatia bacterium]
MPAFDDHQIMLCLAGLAYRGVHRTGAGRFHTETIGRSIAEGLDTLPPLASGWDLAWGPAGYRAPVSVIDDTLLYVARDRQRPRRYVVAIRGTNPGSAFDWAFGDLWAGHQTPWAYGDGGAAVSLSTALGLTVLLQLRSDGPRSDVVTRIWDTVDARLDGIQMAATAAMEVLAALARPALRPMRHAFTDVVQAMLAVRGRLEADVANAPLGAVAARWQSRTRTLLLDLVAEAQPLTGGRAELAVLALLETEAGLRAHLGTGADLQQFLAGAVVRGADEIVVTGHSKGGALASTLALALAETQGDAGGWDPERRATVHCWSYAGPTAGNAAFAARSDAIIGPRCHRIANALDVVPHAWSTDGLAAIAGLYDARRVAPLAALAPLTAVITTATAHLHYRHVGTHVTVLDGVLEPTAVDFVSQLVHQHMQAYCDLLGLAEHGIGTRTFFDPLTLLPGNGRAAIPA